METQAVRHIDAGDSLVFSWTRPPSYWDVAGPHLPVAFVTALALFLPEWVSCEIIPIRECTFLNLTGYPCPFCGFTRSFWAIAGGDWTFAALNCPLACLLYAAVALVFAWNATGLVFGIRMTRGRLLRLRPGLGRWAAGIVFGLVFLNWAYRLSLGLK